MRFRLRRGPEVIAVNYELMFWLLVAFLAGRYFPRSFYIGTDREKYEKADIGILLKDK